jgi:hypothetical protein
MWTSMAWLAAVALMGCTSLPRALDAGHASALRDSVSDYVAGVAHRISAGGPKAWIGEFADDSAFFMVANGQMAFTDFTAMSRFMPVFARGMPSIVLEFSSVRVDPLAPGLAEFAAHYHEALTDSAGRRTDDSGYVTGVAMHSAFGWRLRDAHWSHPDPVIAPPR